MPLQGVFEWNGPFLAATDALEGALGGVKVFEIIEVLKDGLANVETLCAPGAAGQFFKSFFDGLGKTNSQHETLSLYKYSREEG
jgi:hypothetical protein